MMNVKLNREHFINQYPPFNVINVKETKDIYAKKDIHLYVHIPFCPKKCGYCYYKSIDNATDDAIAEYVESLKKEILLYSQRSEVQNKKVKTLYFGGGTPTILSCKQFEDLATFIFDKFDFVDNFEFCTEARPHEETLTMEKLQLLKELGAKRISFGVQNFNQEILELNQRKVDIEIFYKIFAIARSLNFEKLNIDIMSGMYGETRENWENVIDKVIELSPHSIVFYKMELFYNTKLFRDMRSKKQKVPLMTNAEEIELIRYAYDRLQDEGGYTAANCWHLVKDMKFVLEQVKGIWQGDDMKGFGLTAHSCCDNFLYQNTSIFKEYHQLVKEGKFPIKRAHRLTAKEVMSQAMVYGIKDLYINRAKFIERFDFDIMEIYGETIDQLVDTGLLTLDDEALRVPRKYYVFADDICRKFFISQYETMMLAHVSRG